MVARCLRELVLVLGDPLGAGGAAFDGFDPERAWTAEVERESTHVRCHKLRIAVFLAAMRHFRDALRRRGVEVHYTEMPYRRSQDRGAGLAEMLAIGALRDAPPGHLQLWLGGGCLSRVKLPERAEGFDTLEALEQRVSPLCLERARDR